MFFVHTKTGNPALTNSSGLKGVFAKPRFCIGLVWTVGLTVEIKLRFQNSPAKCGGSPKTYHYSLRLCVLKINEIHLSCVSFKPLETKRKMPSLPFNWQGVPDRTIVWLQKKIRTRREQKNDLIHWAFRRSVPWQFQYWRPRPELTRVLHCNKVLCCYYSKLTRSKWIIMYVL